MQDRYWLYQRDNGYWYLEDRVTRKQESLRTKDPAAAKRIAAARNQAAERPEANIVMAKAYLQVQSPDLLSRTWLDVMKAMEAGYQGPTLYRWQKVMRSEPFQLITRTPLVRTDSSHFLAVLQHPRAGNSTNKWLRILHNRALDLGWILSPVLAKRAWPRIHEKHSRAITWQEHQLIIQSEDDEENRLFYEMMWETGGSQTDIASLHRVNIDEVGKRISYRRRKLNGKLYHGAALVIGERLQRLLNQLPKEGWLFPTLRSQSEGVRASKFAKLCKRLGIKEISLHSYRYAWAERAKAAGMPLREAMAHLGHGSRAIHHAYSEKAEVVTLPLEFYEKQREEKIIKFASSHSLVA